MSLRSALAWRLRRHGLTPRVDEPVATTVDRVIAVRGWPSRSADLSVAVRQNAPVTGGVDKALDAGELIRAYAFRGGSYVFTPSTADLILAVRQLTRVWETPRWQRQGAFEVEAWDPLREAIGELLSEGPKTRDEIADHLADIRRLKNLTTAALGHGADSLYKPLHWWGDICFGPERDGATTFRRRNGPTDLLRQEDIDAHGRELLLRYLHGYGPASEENLRYWLTEGLGVPSRRVAGWIDDLGEQVLSIDVDGELRFVLASDVDDFADAVCGDRVRLLPAFDPWTFGPGTADSTVLAADRRGLLSRGIDFVTVGGFVSGVWRRTRHTLTVEWFEEAGSAPVSAIHDEVGRISRHLGKDLTLDIR